MKIATVTLKSLSPYNQSRQHFLTKKPDESHDEFEQRTWREKGHYDADGIAYIPPTAFNACLIRAAKKIDRKIPGRGNSKYTKHFEGGTQTVRPISLGVKKEDVQPQILSMDGQGRKGGMGVQRWFPHFEGWEGTIDFTVFDPNIPSAVFEEFIRFAGTCVGIGQFRPDRGGFFGRFEVANIAWSE